MYAYRPSPWSSHSRLLSFAGEGQGRRLLDVGSGGVLNRRFAMRGWKVMTLDRDESLNPDLLWDLNGPGQSFYGPGELGRFDLIVCGDVLEHLNDPGGVLTQLLPLLHENGRLLISVPNVGHWWARWTLLRGRWPSQDCGIFDRGHRHFFTQQTIRALVRDAGLMVLYESATPAPFEVLGPVPPILSVLHAWLAHQWPTLVGYQFVLVTAKGHAHG